VRNNLLTRRLLRSLIEILGDIRQYKEAKDMLKNALNMALEVYEEEHEKTIDYMT
jgi:hypothetical protein